MQIILIPITVLIFTVFRNWFMPGYLAGYDSLFYFNESYDLYSIYPYAWNTIRESGFGGSFLPLLWGYPSNGFAVQIFGNMFGLDWSIIDRVAFYFPYLFIAFLSSWFVAKRLFVSSTFALLSGLIYTTNSYILLVMSGGQVHFGLAYALVPLAMYLYICLFQNLSKKSSKITQKKAVVIGKTLVIGIVLTLISMLDIRVLYVLLLGVGAYFIFSLRDIFVNRTFIAAAFSICILTLPIVVTMLHLSYWLIPMALLGGNPVDQLGSGYVLQEESVRFFSFAKLENSLALLHPNWPDNIFGKVGFMKPEFLLLPLLAFSALLFITNQNTIQKKYVVYFSILGLLGSFLAKGTNDPFGDVYLWMFNTIPGFTSFRDPSKWYILIALSYAFLIPFTLQSITAFFQKKKNFFQKYGHVITALLFIFYFAFLLRPTFTSEFTGTLRHSTLPNEYKQVKDYLTNQDSFYRVFWVPDIPHYAYFSNQHRAVSGNEYLRTTELEKVTMFLQSDKAEDELRNAGVKYVIVPYDSEEQIFISDRRFDEKKYNLLVKNLENIKWLTKIESFGKVQIYEIANPKNLFWSADTETGITYTMVNPVTYAVTIQNASQGDRLIFSEAYDSKWQADIDGTKVSSDQFTRYNSFVLPKEGNYSMQISYSPQEWVNKGFFLSVISFVSVLGALVFFRKR